MNTKETMITVPEAILLNKKLTDKDITYYIGLKYYCGNCKGGYFTVKYLSATLWGDINRSGREDTRIIRGSIKNLKENNIIDLPYYDAKVFSLRHIHNNDKYFGTINADTFIKLFRSKRKNKYSLIRFLCLLNKSMNHTFKIGDTAGIMCNMPESYFANKLSRSAKTICDYVKALEEMEIIYVVRPGVRQKNMYCLYENKALLDKIKHE